VIRRCTSKKHGNTIFDLSLRLATKRKRRLQPLPNMARCETRELGQEGQVEYRMVRKERMTALIQAGSLCFVTLVLVLDVFHGCSSESVLSVGISARLEGRCLQRPGRRTFLLNNRKRRVRPLAGQRSKIDYEDEFEYEDDKNKAHTHLDPLCAGV
jgi:hypothetical protein